MLNKRFSRRGEIRTSTMPSVLVDAPINVPKIKHGRPATTLIGMVKGAKFGCMSIIGDEPVRADCLKTPDGRNRSRYYVRVRCDCGNELWLKSAYLKSVLPKSCKNCRAANRRGPHRSLPGREAFWRNRLRLIQKKCKKEGIDFNLTSSEMEAMWVNQSGKCALSGWDISLSDPYNLTLDRITPSVGYTVGNVWWAHRKVNMVKQDLSLKDLVSLCKEIVRRFDDPADFGRK
jgi:hypothetical protein